MMDYSELVKALLLCQFGECGCGKCYYKELKGDWCTEDNHPEFFDCDDKLKLDAAAAIEDMAKHITEMHERVTVLQIARGELEAEVKRLEPKRGEWIDRYDEDDKPFFKRKYVCSACGGRNTYGKSKYCPNCGAKMEVQE